MQSRLMHSATSSDSCSDAAQSGDSLSRPFSSTSHPQPISFRNTSTRPFRTAQCTCDVQSCHLLRHFRICNIRRFPPGHRPTHRCIFRRNNLESPALHLRRLRITARNSFHLVQPAHTIVVKLLDGAGVAVSHRLKKRGTVQQGHVRARIALRHCIPHIIIQIHVGHV